MRPHDDNALYDTDEITCLKYALVKQNRAIGPDQFPVIMSTTQGEGAV
jgi:hypothetical protein